jgi:hypothetical protein
MVVAAPRMTHRSLFLSAKILIYLLSPQEFETRVRSEELAKIADLVFSCTSFLRKIKSTYARTFTIHLAYQSGYTSPSSQWSFNFFLHVGLKHFRTIILNSTASLGNKRGLCEPQTGNEPIRSSHDEIFDI